MKTNRFVIRKNLVGKNTIIEFTNKEGKTYQYSPSKVFSQLQDRFEAMPCWDKYKSYTNTNNLPKFVRDLDSIV